MLKIRLARMGKKKQPTYRVVVSEHTKDTYGDYLEKLGHFDPRRKVVELNAERIKHWISKGAKPSETVHNLLIEKGIMEGKKVAVSNITKKRQEKMAEKPARNASHSDAGGEKSSKDVQAPKDSKEPKEEAPKEPVNDTAEAPKEEKKGESAKEDNK